MCVVTTCPVMYATPRRPNNVPNDVHPKQCFTPSVFGNEMPARAERVNDEWREDTQVGAKLQHTCPHPSTMHVCGPMASLASKVNGAERRSDLLHRLV